MHFSTALASLAALASSALASPYIYKPVSASSYKAGDSFTVSWRDSGEAPLSTLYNQTTVSLYTGSSLVQTEVTQLGTVDDAATDTELLITIDATWGPDSDEYFIRLQSVSGTDDAGTPLQAFSARFTLSDMTGTWSSAASAALAGSSAAAVSASATSATSSSASMTTSVRSTTKSSATKSSAAATVSSAAASKVENVASSAASSGASASASSTSGAAGRVAAGALASFAGMAAVIALT